jgi:hypothetical protein
VFGRNRVLAERRARAVLARGLAVLSDGELASLALNPVALYDLYDLIGERLPAAWLEVLERDGRALLEEHHLEVPAELTAAASECEGLLVACLEEGVASPSPHLPVPHQEWRFEVRAEECMGTDGKPLPCGRKATVELAWFAEGYLLVRTGGLLEPDAHSRLEARWLATDGTLLAEGAVARQAARLRLNSPNQRGPQPGDRLSLRYVRGGEEIKLIVQC